ncbi:hypothetical protein D1BOALGB6SA_3297 [Olavius sp. associated proteobacterium Delta 1]|nr:hypothetical protein D1BOALGB6SA_3297 [Olavius sp. associated proteobacterium Delta 1]
MHVEKILNLLYVEHLELRILKPKIFEKIRCLSFNTTIIAPS